MVIKKLRRRLNAPIPIITPSTTRGKFLYPNTETPEFICGESSPGIVGPAKKIGQLKNVFLLFALYCICKFLYKTSKASPRV
jgi:hypothetical protein